MLHGPLVDGAGVGPGCKHSDPRSRPDVPYLLTNPHALTPTRRLHALLPEEWVKFDGLNV